MLLFRLFSRSNVVLLALSVLSPVFMAQRTQAQPLPTSHNPTRKVLVDVAVTDMHGNPVTSLPESSFHIYDNGHRQTAQSVVDHSATGGHPLSHATAARNIVLIDITAMKIGNQRALRKQLVRVLGQTTLHEPMAVYLHNGPRIRLIQSFTTDRKKLIAAVRRAIPHLHPAGIHRDTDISVLSQMTHYLSQYPGHKSLIWFTAGTNVLLLSKPRTPHHQESRVSFGLSPLYNAIAAERIALYPVAVRRLGTSTSDDTQFVHQNALMTAEAAATGGRAYQGVKSIAQVTRMALDNSSNFYTFTYLTNSRHDSRHWHSIRITVDGPYRLRYRHGYFSNNYQSALQPRPSTVAHAEMPWSLNGHEHLSR